MDLAGLMMFNNFHQQLGIYPIQYTSPVSAYSTKINVCPKNIIWTNTEQPPNNRAFPYFLYANFASWGWPNAMRSQSKKVKISSFRKLLYKGIARNQTIIFLVSSLFPLCINYFPPPQCRISAGFRCAAAVVIPCRICSHILSFSIGFGPCLYGRSLCPGFENPGHAGHMCPATFQIRQPYLAAPRNQQNLNGWASHFAKGDGWAEGPSIHFST